MPEDSELEVVMETESDTSTSNSPTHTQARTPPSRPDSPSFPPSSPTFAPSSPSPILHRQLDHPSTPPLINANPRINLTWPSAAKHGA
jgi:hypothetical protein